MAVGDDGFVERVKANLGRLVSKMSVNEDPAYYGQQADIIDSILEWQIFDDNELQSMFKYVG